MTPGKKLTPAEIHKLAMAPLPTFNIIPTQCGSAGTNFGKYSTNYGLDIKVDDSSRYKKK